MKNIIPGNYTDTRGKENEITRVRIWSSDKDATIGKCFVINNSLRVILFSNQLLENAGQDAERELQLQIAAKIDKREHAMGHCDHSHFLCNSEVWRLKIIERHLF